MRILVISAMFPPFVQGGAEISAYNLSLWLRGQGHEVAVLTVADAAEPEEFGAEMDGMTLYRLGFPRPYSIRRQGRGAPPWQKPLWHLQDHLDPRNRAIMARVITHFRPDFANVHYAMGLGHNALAELVARDIPILYVLPDLALVCLRATMFRRGHACKNQCPECRLSSAAKWSALRRAKRLGFAAPSRATLDQVMTRLPDHPFPARVIANANAYPAPTVTRTNSDRLRLVYVGRLDAPKGVDVLIRAVARLDPVGALSLRIVGDGAEATPLSAAHGHHPWLTFTGHLPLQEAVNEIANADLVCLPSLWPENSPGAAIIALKLGVPLLGSAIGGLPELIRHGENGLLAEPGDVESWRATLARLISDPPFLASLAEGAAASSGRFDKDALGAEYLDFMNDIKEQPRHHAYRDMARTHEEHGMA